MGITSRAVINFQARAVSDIRQQRLRARTNQHRTCDAFLKVRVIFPLFLRVSFSFPFIFFFYRFYPEKIFPCSLVFLPAVKLGDQTESSHGSFSNVYRYNTMSTIPQLYQRAEGATNRCGWLGIVLLKVRMIFPCSLLFLSVFVAK